MGTTMTKHERPAQARGDAAEEIDETATQRIEPPVAGLAGRAEDSADGVDGVEGSMDRGDGASLDSGGLGPMSAPEHDAPDDLEIAVKARVFQTLFGRPARPTMLGRYVVLGTLGQGGMGTVLEAFDRTLDRKVAIKVLHEDLGHEHTTRLLREAQAMAKLSHPNVVPVFEADTTGGQTFVVMELVQGRTLRRWIRQHPRPDWRQCVEVFTQAGQGLAAAHARGLVHRDFKPSNAILDDEGRVRVLDFGLARRTVVELTDDDGLDRERDDDDGDASLPGPPAQERADGETMRARDDDPLPLEQGLTVTGMVLGTPAYMPPEQMQGREADARSDQFSFCVSLHEAVYGERPFPGDTIAELMASMMGGRVQPPPKGSPVPTRLRTLLLRGLAIDPAKRWPTMEALLHELRTLGAPRTRRWMAVGVTAGLAALGGGLALGQYVEVKDRCTGAAAQLDGIWDDARRQQVRSATLSTERSFAPSTWARVEPRLDAYADAWIAAHTEICEATSVRGEQSDEALDLRMRCLGRRRTALRATIDGLAHADDHVVENAVALVAGLPTLARCDDLPWLEQQDQRMPPPEDPDVAAAVQAQRARLADLAVMDKVGRYPEALDAARAVVQQAQTLDYPPLWAEALYQRGSLRHGNGQYAEAEADLRQAHTMAVQHYHDQVALDTARALTCVLGNHLARHAEGQQWGEMNALPLAQRSGEPLQEADSLHTLGRVFFHQGDPQAAKSHHQRALEIRDEVLGPDHPDVASSVLSLGNVCSIQGDHDNARVHYQRALAILEKALGPDHPDTAYGLANLGSALSNLGDHDQALAHFQRALTILEKALGPDHPDVATSLNNLGNVVADLGDLDQARVHYERALAIWQKALGPDHPDVATSLNNLGNVFFSQGDVDEARVHHQRALAIQHKALGPDHPDVATSLHSLGSVSWRQGDLDEARVHFERALAIKETILGPDDPGVAQSLESLGLVLAARGDLDDARAHQERALAIKEETLGPDDPDVAYPLIGLATTALDMGDPASARAHAERAVSVREAVAVAPALLAEARFVLARALWNTHSEWARARTLAEQARDALAAAEGPGTSDVDLAEVGAWLATHRVK